MITFHVTKSQRLLIIIVISFSFFLAEISVGFYTGALVLVADAFHYLNDLVGYIVAFAALKVSKRDQAPKILPFGWQRATLLGAFFNGVFLFGLGVSVFLQSVERFVSMQRVENPKLVLIIGIVGLILNIVSAAVIHEHSHDHALTPDPETELSSSVNRTQIAQDHLLHRHESITGPRNTHQNSGHDLGTMGVLLHIMGDAANNVGVIIAALVIWRAKYPARYYADPATSMGIALMIILSSLPLMKKSGSILMQSTPAGVDPDDVRHDLEAILGVIAVHDLHIWLLNQHKAVASAHVVVSKDVMTTMEDFMNLASTINECFHAYGVHSATLQPEVVSLHSTTATITTPCNLDGQPRDTTHGGQTGLSRSDSSYPCRVGCRSTSCEESTCCD